ncbi:MAG TPA: VWA domain-containing protein [Thermoanaerobaculaceae bacterium]|nr:VWA domain-containing protein [Thermoanaerobaculaceae bacterium]
MVSVTDANGAPIRGLRASDFVVLEDGAPVRVDRVRPGPGAAAAKAGAAPADPTPALLTLLVDGAGLAAPQAKAASDAAAEALAGFLSSPGAQVMVAAGWPSVKVIRPFTTDAGAAREALESAFAGSGSESASPTAGADAAVESLDAFVASLGGLPGRKALLYIGGGQRSAPAAGSPAAGDPLAASTAPGQSGAPPADRGLAEAANAAGVRVYTVDAGGGPAPGLREAAAATGGTAATAAAGAFTAMNADFLAAYTLTYLAPHGGDGAIHRLEVRVRREGAVVRAGLAARRAADEDRIAERTRAALRYGVTDNPLGIQLAAAFDAKPREGSPVVSVLVTIPLGGLSFAPTKVAHECNLTLWLTARDAGGRTVQAPRARLPVSVPNDRLLTALTQSVGYTFRVPLAAGPATFAVTVRDEIAMREATAVTVAAPADEPAKGESR